MTAFRPVSRWRFVLFAGGLLLSPIDALAQIPKSVLGPKDLAAWPPEIKQIAEEIYKNKVATMSVYNMRLREFDETAGRNGYVRGNAFVQGMEALAKATDEKLLENAKVLEGADLIAKLIVLASDRKGRPEKYETIRTRYLDFTPPPPPPGGRLESMTYFSPEVQPEHLNEDWRLPIEYAFFAPPTAPGFKTDVARLNLSYAIWRINNQHKSNLLMLADAVSAVPHLGNEELREHQILGFSWVIGHPNPANGAFLDAGLGGPDAEKLRRQCLERVGLLVPKASVEKPQPRPEVWQRWQEFFKQNPNEREKSRRLAEFFEEAAAMGGKKAE